MSNKNKLNIHKIEKVLIKSWDKDKIYCFDSSRINSLKSIDTPPPYLSGNLHVGHVMSYTHIDFIARFWRMMGYNVLFPGGYDDNGLPTERFVEKKLKKEGIPKSSLNRDQFTKICLNETHRLSKEYRKVWDQVGLSIDEQS